jgi:1,4-alpha-glucan branching enzyme
MSSPLLGEMDLYLFGEGKHWRLWDALGANIETRDGVDGARFAVWAPNAHYVNIVGEFNGWDPDATPLEPQGSSGIFAGFAPGARAGHHYKLVIETPDCVVRWKADPMARRCELPPGTASIIDGPAEHIWADDEWIAHRTATPSHENSLRIYEVHAMSWRPGLQWRELAHQLADYVADLGFTHVELLPIAEHPFGPSWGYQVTGFYAPTARMGTPDDFRYFIDHLHGRGIGVILDWVPAHFPKDEWALGRFDGTALYEHLDPRMGEHPDWGTYVFNFGRTEVRNFLVANALYWVNEFHIDGLRVDAVASMLYLDYSRAQDQWVPNRHGGKENLEAIEFLQEFNAVVHGEHPGILTIAEESTSYPKVSRPVFEGGLGFSHKWNMGWMHDTLAYMERHHVHRSYHHNELTFGLLYAFSEQFVLPLSHDEVVHGKGSLLHKFAGDDWQRFAGLRALYGWMWAYPGGKLIFMGCEFGQRPEWNEETGLDWIGLESPNHQGVLDLVRAANKALASTPALAKGDHDSRSFRWLDADDAANSIYSFLRYSPDGNEAVACIANFTPVPRDGYRVGLPWAGEWTVLLDTNAVYFGGSGYGGVGSVPATDAPCQRQPASAVITLPPLSVLWLTAKLPGA